MNKIKRMLSIFSSIAIISAISFCNIQLQIPVMERLSITANAETTNLGFVYTIENNKATITGYTGSSTQISIPSSINGYSVTKIGKDAFSGKSITSVVIPSSVKELGDNSFDRCHSLKTVTIYSGLTSIGSCAFRWCDSLTSITLPSTLQKINNHAFFNCSSLSTVNINSSYLKIIPNACFNGCSSLKQVVIPYSVEIIEQFAFSNCSSLTTVTIPSNSKLTEIYFNAFSNSAKLKDISIPNTVYKIGDDAFMGCTSLSNVNITSTNRYIHNDAFKGTPYYANNYTETKHPNYNLGPAKLCKGKQLVYTIFLEDNSTYFSESEKEAKREMIVDATNKISMEAVNYGSGVNFTTSKDNTLLETTKRLPNNELTNILNGTSSTYIFSLLDDVPELTYDGRRTLLSHYNASGISYVIFINRGGTSYTVIGNWEEFNEKSLVYNDSRGSAVVMHEMLHLFGAPDLYNNSYMSQHYNEDIMVKCSSPCMIGPVTAYAIGWLDGILKTEYDMLYGS